MHDLEGQDLNAYMVKQNLEKRVYLSRLGTSDKSASQNRRT